MPHVRLLREYAFATYYGADERLTRWLPTAIRLARARLKHGIGPIPFSVYGLAHVPDARWDSYVIKKLSTDAVLNRINPQELRCVARNKVLFYEHCQRNGLPTIPITCRVGGTPDPLGHSVEHVTDAARLGELLESTAPRIFAKPIAGTYGEGAFLIVRRDAHFEFGNREGTAMDLFAYLEQQSAPRSGYVLQPQIRPHPELLPLAAKNGLPTARVVTAMRDQGPEVLFACLKMPVGASITDNFAHGASGNLLAGIDPDDGALTPARGSRRRNWPVMVRVDTHPDSGYRIAGSRLSLWTEIATLALQGQQSLPGFMTIGWDVTATRDGAVLVEANRTYDMDILQIAHQRGLKREWAAKLNVAMD